MSHPSNEPTPLSERNTAAPGVRPELPEATTGPFLPAPSEPTSQTPTSGEEVVLRAALQVPGYEIVGVLGRGGMGVVYKARQTQLKRLVALKLMLSGGYAWSEERDRFLAEPEAVARVQHSHIVQIHEIGEYHGLPYFSMEYCPGGSLARNLQGKPLPPLEAAPLVETLAGAVQAVHQAGVVHRNLQPANILLTADGQPRIANFGMAKMLDQADRLTASTAITSTPSYMAPEQARRDGDPLRPAVDIYALGAILYELLTGRPPFRAETPLETFWQVIEQDLVPVRQLNPGVPVELEAICMKCLQKRPSQRYARAADLAADLRRFQAGEAISLPMPARGGWQRGWLQRGLGKFRDRWMTVTVMGMCILLICAALIAYSGGANFKYAINEALLPIILAVLISLSLGFLILGYRAARRMRNARRKGSGRWRRVPSLISLALGRENLRPKSTYMPEFLTFEERKNRLQIHLVEMLGQPELSSLDAETQRQETRMVAERFVNAEDPSLNRMERERLLDEVLDEVFGLGPLEMLVNDPHIQEIQITAPNSVLVRKNQNLERSDVVFRNAVHLQNVVERLLTRAQITVGSPGLAGGGEGTLSDCLRFKVIPSPLPGQPPLVHLRRVAAPASEATMVTRKAPPAVTNEQPPSEHARWILNRLVGLLHQYGFEDVQHVDPESLRQAAAQLSCQFRLEKGLVLTDQEQHDVVAEVLARLNH